MIKAKGTHLPTLLVRTAASNILSITVRGMAICHHSDVHVQLPYIKSTLIARFMGPTWGPSVAERTQMGPMLAHEICYLGSDTSQNQDAVLPVYHYQLMFIMEILVPWNTVFILKYATESLKAITRLHLIAFPVCPYYIHILIILQAVCHCCYKLVSHYK